MRRTVLRTVLALTAGLALLVPVQGVVPSAAAAPQPAEAGPANGLIAYGTYEQGSPGWVTIRSDGSDRTFHPLPDWAEDGVYGVDWSPDGTELVFSAVVEVPDGGSLYSILLGEPSGSGWYWLVTNWAADVSGDGDFSPAWSSRGTHVAFSRLVGGVSRIAETNAAGYAPQLRSAGEDFDPAYSVNDDLAFTRSSGPTPGVWISPASGGADYLAVPGGSHPAFSPDGTRLAYVAGGPQPQLYTADPDGTDVAQVTVGGATAGPAWSPDGTQIAYAKGTQLCVAPALGGTESCIDDIGGSVVGTPFPSWQPVPADPEPVVRVAGQTRLGTAIAASTAGFDDGAAAAAVLARSDTFPDALAGTPLAVKKGGPLLLTPPTALDPTVGAELSRVLGAGSGKTVYLLGGTGALSPAVETAVEALGFTATRLAGATRYETAVAVAEALGSPETLFLATGRNFPDALAAGTAAGSWWLDPDWGGGAVLLTADRVLPASVSAYLADHSSAYVEAVGGQAAAAYPAADEKLVGSDRYETAEYVALSNFGAAQGAGVATGLNFPDALAGGVLLAANNQPLLLTRPTGLPTATDGYLSVFSGSVDFAFVFGGTGVIPNAIMSEVGSAIGLAWEPYSVATTTMGPASRAALASVPPPDAGDPKEHPAWQGRPLR